MPKRITEAEGERQLADMRQMRRDVGRLVAFVCCTLLLPAPQRIARRQDTAALRDFDRAHVRLGQKRQAVSNLDHVRFTPKADKKQKSRLVHFVPIAS